MLPTAKMYPVQASKPLNVKQKILKLSNSAIAKQNNTESKKNKKC
jgi:hypothetical protein